ncbi:MAG: hypothetical protein ACOVNL_05835 [Prochlorococcaceae cyanobacterium]
MVASPSPQFQPRARARRSLELIQGSLASGRAERSSPWLASFHRASDGALVGLGLAMLGLSALTLYWQAQWGRSYQKLESSQVLEHRLQEATAVLEQHHLGLARTAGLVEPTSSEKLVYLPAPPQANGRGQAPLLASIRFDRISSGY